VVEFWDFGIWIPATFLSYKLQAFFAAPVAIPKFRDAAIAAVK
jgi:hypothetical protein